MTVALLDGFLSETPRDDFKPKTVSANNFLVLLRKGDTFHHLIMRGGANRVKWTVPGIYLHFKI